MADKKIHTRENGLKFSHIKIRPIVKNRKYMSMFSMGYDGEMDNLMMETTIGGDSAGECLKKTAKFLDIELKENEYTFL